MTQIHPTALVDSRAELDDEVSIGPFTIIGPKVRIGARTRVASHCVIEGRTTMGCDNTIFQFCSIGAIPQDKKYAGEDSELIIGDRNTIREYCSFSIGVSQAGGRTTIGNDNWIMGNIHIAHDCHVGNHTTLANYTGLAGHVELGDWVTVGGITGIHQFVKVGAYAMIGFASAVSQDVPPFMLVDGNPLAVRGFNLVGLRRHNFSSQRIEAVKQMHKILYREGRTLDSAKTAIAALVQRIPEAAEDVARMSDFLAHATRGIAR
ncbi:MAG: acyl-ACP--UDP-N-acetylglucosamine O-acyltransferase [Burkholderiaceae bacterium]|jgi:UDP-N-acetylglucosamine acyltransferase|nr:acyl-ACP--UDP-N-acetylglucosamine O-acyltransferase [Burkholderiaceae bacterium]